MLYFEVPRLRIAQASSQLQPSVEWTGIGSGERMSGFLEEVVIGEKSCASPQKRSRSRSERLATDD